VSKVTQSSAVARALRLQGEASIANGKAMLALAKAMEADTGADDRDDDPIVRVAVRCDGVVPRRVINAACAAGEVEGARKVGRQWVARRSVIDAWILRSQPGPEPSSRVARWKAGGAL